MLVLDRPCETGRDAFNICLIAVATLIGNNQNGEIFRASLFGKDTLTAGNGTGDALYAGEGVDTITGGTGGDTFGISSSLATGTVITGEGIGNTLQVSYMGYPIDLSGATITGIQNLTFYSPITLSAAELNGFTNIMDISGGGGTIPSTLAHPRHHAQQRYRQHGA